MRDLEDNSTNTKITSRKKRRRITNIHASRYLVQMRLSLRTNFDDNGPLLEPRQFWHVTMRSERSDSVKHWYGVYRKAREARILYSSTTFDQMRLDSSFFSEFWKVKFDLWDWKEGWSLNGEGRLKSGASRATPPNLDRRCLLRI
jgi:hypothetical protein